MLVKCGTAEERSSHTTEYFGVDERRVRAYSWVSVISFDAEWNHGGNEWRATTVGQNVSEGAIAANARGIVIEKQFDTMVYGNGLNQRPSWKAEAFREWK